MSVATTSRMKTDRQHAQMKEFIAESPVFEFSGFSVPDTCPGASTPVTK
jgi:hypothetical protein